MEEYNSFQGLRNYSDDTMLCIRVFGELRSKPAPDINAIYEGNEPLYDVRKTSSREVTNSIAWLSVPGHCGIGTSRYSAIGTPFTC